MMNKELLEETLRGLGLAINAALRSAHESGLSVRCEANGYDVQLQDGELLQMVIGINDCVHKFQSITSIDQQIGNRKKRRKYTFARCSKCSLTRSVYDDSLTESSSKC